MLIKFWGIRGTIPTPGHLTEKYGGNTSCVEIRSPEGDIFICDAGSGIRGLGQALLREFRDKPIEAHLLISHLHWDHIQGFPLFAPAFAQANHFVVHGPENIETAMHGQMVKAYFPVPLGAMGAKLDFQTVQTSAPWQSGKVQLRAASLAHPGGAVGYRLECKGRSVAYVTDNELADTKPDAPLSMQMAGLSHLVKGADLMIADAQYTRREYAEKKGWGHSAVEDVILFAAQAGVKMLALFHHDPSHSDEFMDELFQHQVEQLSRTGASLELFVAREGMAIEV